MSQKTKDINALFDEGTEIDRALQKAVREALLEHKHAGNPVASEKNGQVVWIAPEDIEVGTEDT